MDPELETVLSEYLLAAEAGTAPPQVEWLARHPRWRAELAEFLAGHARLAAFIAPLRPPDSPFPRPFGRFVLLSQLGAGGMGVVYRARVADQSREVALKTLRGGRLGGAADRARFRTEVLAAGRLAHPAIAPVFDADEQDGQPYYTMPLLAGGDMVRSRLRFAATPLAAAAVVRDLARAVEHAHGRGVLHRDLKPSNVLFDPEGRPYLTDFGLAKLTDDSAGLTRTGQAVGTPAYSAPECLTGGPPTTAADVYGLGGILYFALTGRPAIDGPTRHAVVEAALSRDPPPPSRLNSAVPPDLDAIALQCLAKAARRRYPSAGLVADDLDRFLNGRSVTARRPGRVERLARSARRRPAFAALLAGLVALAGLTGLTAWRRYDDTRRLNADLGVALGRERDQSARVRQFDYAGRVKYAAELLNAGQPEDAAEVLTALRPADGESDLREFAWSHLWRSARTRIRVGVHRTGALCCAFSPDGRFVALAGGDGQIGLIDVETGLLLRRWDARGLVAYSTYKVEFGPNGRHLFTGEAPHHGSQARLGCWDVGDGRQLAEVYVPLDQLGGLLPEQDGTLRVFGGGSDGVGRVLRWSPADGSVREEHRDPAGVYLIARRSPDGKTIYAATTPVQAGLLSETARLIEMPADRPAAGKVFDTVPSFCLQADVSPDGQHLAVACARNNTYFWRTSSLERTWETTFIARELQSTFMAWSKHSTGITVISRHPTEASLSAVAECVPNSREVKTLNELLPHVYGISRNAAGTVTALACNDGTIRLRRSDRPVPFDPLPGHPKEAWDVAFSPDGRTLATTSDDDTVNLIDVPSRTVRVTLTGHPSLVTSVAFAPDDREVYTGGWDGTVRTWNPVSGAESARRHAHPCPVNRVAVSPDGRWVASVGRDANLVVWDRSAGSVRHTIRVGQARGKTLAFSADSRLLTVGGMSSIDVYDTKSGLKASTRREDDNSDPVAIRIDARETLVGNRWGRLVLRGDDGQPRFSVQAHPTRVMSLAVTPDGRTIATGGLDGAVKLWHRPTGRLLVELAGRGPQVNGLAFSPDGRMLAGCDHAGAVRLWHGSFDGPPESHLR